MQFLGEFTFKSVCFAVATFSTFPQKIKIILHSMDDCDRTTRMAYRKMMKTEGRPLP